ncbi:MAG: Rubredoxin [Elusimicrobia bacterium RIFOXYC2_FULL_34_12]|nr:MAG: Rubredoxin [Elusimicrobia bacterium RIFOXYC2_FULL_34_12]OGS38741.1 MAG: Rubredoxin [Elusimicrobia bacterium RIFOXYD2_FULL_34_30]
MDKWQCLACPYIYESEKGDPINGVQPGTKFEHIPDYWVCPVCGISKDHFERIL